MGDSWEDWEDEEITVPAPVVGGQEEKDKFADEDKEEDDPKWKGSVPETQKVRYCGSIFQPTCVFDHVLVAAGRN
jgi:hypothetical protein